MCGRFVSSSTPDELAAYFGVDNVAESVLAPAPGNGGSKDEEPPAGPRANYNVAPTQDVFAIVEDDVDDEVQRYLDAFFWGLVPSWAKDVKIGSRMINARAETLAEKNAYKSSFKKRRCIIPADGFYEWKKLDPSKKKSPKQPMFVQRADGKPLAFAGLWSVWRGPDKDQDPLRSVTIITTRPNETMRPIHDRMPVILGEDDWATWLDRGNDDIDMLGRLLVPAPDDLLTTRTVSTEVNNVGNNGPSLIEDAEPIAL
ncbi:MAG: SOS response-associated peptidase [Acidimicrobiales bacterium]|nr:SOS response-associated peptidase [Acidimicrobiales bacterium]